MVHLFIFTFFFTFSTAALISMILCCALADILFAATHVQTEVLSHLALKPA